MRRVGHEARVVTNVRICRQKTRRKEAIWKTLNRCLDNGHAVECNGLIWINTGTAGSFEHGNKRSGYIKCKKFLH